MKKYFLIAIWGLYPAFSLADCQVNNDNGVTNGASGPNMGQSFIPCETGLLTSLTFWVTSNATSVSGDLFIAQNPGNGQIISGTPIQQFNVPISGNSSREPIFLELSSPISVTAGVSYRFELVNLTEFIALSFSNPYPGGRMYANGGLTQPNEDFDFIANIVSFGGSPTQVPTLGIFAKILIILLISFIGIYSYRNLSIHKDSV